MSRTIYFIMTEKMKKAPKTKKSKEDKGFDYEGAYHQQQQLIADLQHECSNLKHEAELYKDKWLNSVRKHSKDQAEYCDRVSRLETSECIAKDAFRAAQYWGWFMDSILPWYKKLFYREKLRIMENEIHSLSLALEGLDRE